MTFVVLCLVLGGAAFAAGFGCGALFLRAWFRADTADQNEDEPLAPAAAWRKLRLACGDHYQHPDACCALQGLRCAGYEVRLDGGDSQGYADVEITSPALNR